MKTTNLDLDGEIYIAHEALTFICSENPWTMFDVRKGEAVIVSPNTESGYPRRIVLSVPQNIVDELITKGAIDKTGIVYSKGQMLIEYEKRWPKNYAQS